MSYEQFVKMIGWFDWLYIDYHMKKNRFQQKKEQNEKANYFDENEDIQSDDDNGLLKDVLTASIA